MRRGTLTTISLGATALILIGLLVAVGQPARGPGTVLPPSDAGAALADPAPDDRPWSAVAWRRLVGATPLGAEPGHDRFDGLVTAPGGLVAWGRTSTPGRNQFNDVAAIFLSSSGDEWQTVPLVSGVAPADTSEIQHVAAGPSGFLVFGGVCCDFEERLALWVSGDGRDWDRVPFPEAMLGANIAQVVATGGPWVAVGTDAAANAAIWTSANGQDWAAVEDERAELGPGGINGLAVTADGLTAVGWRDTGPTYDGAMWQSPAGLEWTPVELDPVFAGDLDTVINRATRFADGWWAFGSEGPNEDRVACERALGRIASIDPEVVPPEGRPAFSCGWGHDTFWVSDDGTAWERLPVRAFGVPARRGELIEFRFVAAGSPGLVAMGEGSGDSHPSLFVSADGREWQRLPAQPSFTIGQSISGFALFDGQPVVVGDDWNPNNGQAARPAIWFGEVH